MKMKANFFVFLRDLCERCNITLDNLDSKLKLTPSLLKCKEANDIPSYDYLWAIENYFFQNYQAKYNEIFKLEEADIVNDYLKTHSNFRCYAEENMDKYNTKTYFRIPVYSTASCGVGKLASDDIVDYEWKPFSSQYDADNTFLLKVSGDSMEPIIHSGEIVTVKRTPEPQSGDIVVALVEHEFGETDGFVKRLVKETNRIELKSENKNFETMIFLGKNIQSVRIIGKVEKK